jgi:membrane protease YdiL (CAAX protease family)
VNEFVTVPDTTVAEDVRRAITNVAVPYNEPPSVVRRRRFVVAVVLVCGAVVLGLSLTRHPGQPSFYWLSLALTAVWFVGAFASGPLHLGGVCWRGRNQRPIISGTGIGLLLGGIFILGGLVAREIPPVAHLITHVLLFTNQGSWRLTLAIALVAAVAEELFYRGALYTAFGRNHPLLNTTVVYVIVCLASRNVMLGFAAVLLGTVSAFERRSTGGVLASVLTHFVWSLVVVIGLPPLFGL